MRVSGTVYNVNTIRVSSLTKAAQSPAARWSCAHVKWALTHKTKFRNRVWKKRRRSRKKEKKRKVKWAFVRRREKKERSQMGIRKVIRILTGL